MDIGEQPKPVLVVVHLFVVSAVFHPVVISEKHLALLVGFFVVRGPPRPAGVVVVVEVVLQLAGLAELGDALVGVEDAGEESEPSQPAVAVVKAESRLELLRFPFEVIA